jgi:hypothetical protein
VGVWRKAQERGGKCGGAEESAGVWRKVREYGGMCGSAEECEEVRRSTEESAGFHGENTDVIDWREYHTISRTYLAEHIYPSDDTYAFCCCLLRVCDPRASQP